MICPSRPSHPFSFLCEMMLRSCDLSIIALERTGSKVV